MVVLTQDNTLDTTSSPYSMTPMHSPYCEARGPIVQEGFVAARVRALNALQHHNEAYRATSHSPMIPCPGNERFGSKPRNEAPDTQSTSWSYSDLDRPRSSGPGMNCTQDVDLNRNIKPVPVSLTTNGSSDKSNRAAWKKSNHRVPYWKMEILRYIFKE